MTVDSRFPGSSSEHFPNSVKVSFQTGSANSFDQATDYFSYMMKDRFHRSLSLLNCQRGTVRGVHAEMALR